MSVFTLFLIALFLPLFPLSMVFNYLLERITNPLLKAVILLLWPLLGIIIFTKFNLHLPDWVTTWIAVWAALTALLYGFRLLTERDIHRWVGLLITALWSLLWLPLLVSTQQHIMLAYALSLSAPLVLLTLLADQLKQRFGVAYTHIYTGLASSMPRFAGILVVTVLAATATPVFPAFFIMLKTVSSALSLQAILLASIILVSWLCWSWAGIRLLQGTLVGPGEQQAEVKDISRSLSWAFAVALMLLAMTGMIMIGDMT